MMIITKALAFLVYDVAAVVIQADLSHKLLLVIVLSSVFYISTYDIPSELID